jgi:hypothetical protein
MGSAPPVPVHPPNDETRPREYWRWHFAGLAMQGYLSQHAHLNPDLCATWAVEHADSLIAKLEEEARDDDRRT